MGRNEVSLGQTDLKSDLNKAKATALPSQRLAAASGVFNTQIILRAEGRPQQNKSIFLVYISSEWGLKPKMPLGKAV